MKRAAMMLVFMYASIASAQTLSLNGREYRMQDGQWYQVEYGRQYPVNNSVITVKFREGVVSQRINAFNASRGGRVLRTNVLGFVDIRIPENADPLTMVQDYLNSGLVEIAEPNTFGEYHSDPNDSLFSNQWHHKHAQDHDIDTPYAWDTETGDPSVIIGVLDSGTDILHEDLEGNIWVNPGEDLDGDRVVWDSDDMNGEDDDGNGKVDDLVGWDFFHADSNVVGPYYHGTHVAGIAAAVTHNGEGVAGVVGGWGTSSPGAKMLIAAVGDSYPDASVIDDAILYAASKNAKVITMSLGVGETQAIKSAIESAYLTYGCFINCSSGNSGGPNISFPARARYVVAVGGTGKDDKRASFSSYGDSLDVVAPAVDIWSTRKNDNYNTGSGTSYASPQVAGTAALLKSYDASLTNEDIEGHIARSAEKVREDIYDYNQDRKYGTWNNEMGYGRLNAQHALAEIAPPAAPQNLTVTPVWSEALGFYYPKFTWDANTEPDLQRYRVYRVHDYDPYTWYVTDTTVSDYKMEIEDPPYEIVCYYVKAEDLSSQLSGPSNQVCVGGMLNKVRSTEIGAAGNLPETFALHLSYPNPFNPSTTIRYDLPEASRVSLAIYDVMGREVRRWELHESAGYRQLVWDGKDRSGKLAPAGVYVYRLVALSVESDDHFTASRKMVLMK